MCEAVTVSSLMMVTSIVSEESLARDTLRQTDRQTDRQTRVVYDFANKNSTDICEPLIYSDQF